MKSALFIIDLSVFITSLSLGNASVLLEHHSLYKFTIKATTNLVKDRCLHFGILG